MQALRFWALATAIAVTACSDSSTDNTFGPVDPAALANESGIARVVNSSDAGPGSFRAAVSAANSDASIRLIQLERGLAPIALEQPVLYTGAQDLRIDGNGSVLDGAALSPAAGAAFLADGGGDLALSKLTVRNAPLNGIQVEIPGSSTGVRRFILEEVQALDNQGFGVLINDQTNPDAVGDPGGSAASLDVTVTGCVFSDNGFAALDRDGLRLNEGGDGDLIATITGSRADGNGADGIELDERGAGDTRFLVSASHFTENGSFDQTLADLDDGIDVDESNDGNLIGTVMLSSANDNKEEGFDFNENHAGDLRVDMTSTEASRNLEEGIDLEEDDDFQGGGNLITRLVSITANGNGPGGDAGLKIRERGDGDLEADVRRAGANANTTGGINLREDAAGSLRAALEAITADGNAGHGIDFDENSSGDLTAAVRSGSSSGNGGAGVRADQQLPGSGTVDLIALRMEGNSGGTVVGGGVNVRTPGLP